MGLRRNVSPSSRRGAAWAGVLRTAARQRTTNPLEIRRMLTLLLCPAHTAWAVGLGGRPHTQRDGNATFATPWQREKYCSSVKTLPACRKVWREGGETT